MSEGEGADRQRGTVKGRAGKKERGAYRKRHKVELELFFYQGGLREAERAAERVKEREQAG